MRRKFALASILLLLSGCGWHVQNWSGGPYPTGTCFQFTTSMVGKSIAYQRPTDKYAFIIFVATKDLKPVECKP